MPKGKFFEIRNPRSDKYCQPKLDFIKSRRDHRNGQKEGSIKCKKHLRLYKIFRKMAHNQVND